MFRYHLKITTALSALSHSGNWTSFRRISINSLSQKSSVRCLCVFFSRIKLNERIQMTVSVRPHVSSQDFDGNYCSRSTNGRANLIFVAFCAYA
jgi:hypothetical protein